ncbi:shikimate kinase [Puniceicoccaceae bacterium K14]|nr:shikimate kinase [Puniceicoccaceae bacterium K14]
MTKKKQPNLYLVGFMGTGKSTIGRQVAQKLGFQFIDSDHAIEEKIGMSIAKLFETEGEAAFRMMEREFIEKGHPVEGCLVSCGGGLVVQPGMLDLVKSKGPAICLLASAETIFERTKNNTNRPLLNVEDPLAKIREMLSIREPIYKQVGAEILTDNRTIADVVSHICRSYKLESKYWK